MQHHLDVELAIKYGVPAAIVLDHLQNWIHRNRANSKHNHNGRTWTYNSIQALTAIYPYWSAQQIRRTYDSLTKAGILLKNNFSPKKNDRTLWYAFVDESAFLSEYDICRKRQMDLSKTTNGFVENDKCILGAINEPYIQPNIHEKVKKYSQIHFVHELNEIIPAKNPSDWTAYKNIANRLSERIRTGKNTSAVYVEIKAIARRATKSPKPIATFFKLLRTEKEYKGFSRGGVKRVGDILAGMKVA